MLQTLKGKLDWLRVARAGARRQHHRSHRGSAEGDYARRINQIFKEAAAGPLKGVLEYTTDAIVSSDIVGNPHSCIFDSLVTMVQPGGKGKMVKVCGWYDNEWGYSNRCVQMLALLGK